MKEEMVLGSTEKMESIAGVIKQCEQRGFVERFVVAGDAFYAPSVHKFYLPEDMAIADIYRYEG
jgi:hypothetical protein